jgi:CubicO group peptidase (beta-lactamase class C family)
MRPVEGLCGTAIVTRSGSVQANLVEGLADIEANIACSSSTRFQVASISKQFVAAAGMLLVEAGQLDLQEPVDRWMSSGPPQWRHVTLHHLLSHTAGVPHWREAPGLDPTEPISIDERLDSIAAAPLRTEPGSAWHYSSPGYLLVSSIVARASGQPYRDFVAERVLFPLQLTETTLGRTPEFAARGHHDHRPVAPWDLNAMPGTGDTWSTARDLTRFTAALHSGELLTADSLWAMCSAHAQLDDDDVGEPRVTTTGYGYGMYTGNFGGSIAYYHTGDNPGYRSLAGWIPAHEASIVILLNDDASSVTELLRQLLAVALPPAEPVT